MEIIFMIIAALSFVAFVVGMFNPKTVKCSSRGKVALIFVSVFFVSAIIGGSLSEDKEVISGNPQTQESKTQSQEKSAIGTEVRVGNFVYRVSDFSFRKSVGNEFVGETANGIYLLISLDLMNVDDEPHTLDGSLFSITDLDGRKYEYSTNGSTALAMSGYKTLFLEQCQPNIQMSGILIFEVSRKDKYYLHLAGGFWSSKSIRILLSK